MTDYPLRGGGYASMACRSPESIMPAGASD